MGWDETGSPSPEWAACRDFNPGIQNPPEFRADPWLKIINFSFNPFRCLSDSKGRKHYPVTRHLRRKLFDFFFQENELFFKLSGLKFDWNEEFPTDIHVNLN